jgi:hypothetical protein
MQEWMSGLVFFKDFLLDKIPTNIFDYSLELTTFTEAG